MMKTRVVLASFWLLASTGCGSSSEPGVSVEVVSRSVGLEPGEPVENELGHSFALESAFVTTVAFEILPCQSALRSLWDAMVPDARAHGVSTPTRLASPTVQDALAGEIILGKLSPPAGHYCALVIELGPADADSEALDVAPEALGKALVLYGTSSGEPFVIESTLGLEVRREIDLTLDESHRTATLVIEHAPAQWFDGVDLSAEDGDTLERRVLENLSRSLVVHVD
jgi:hypothetical protein